MKEPSDLLRKGLDTLGIPHTEEQVGAFSVYLAELRKWNRAYNLTGLHSDRDIVIKHFLDSLLFLKVLPREAHSVADIGSGAGFPGVPMKIMRPGLGMILVEPSQKKVLFLDHILRTLHLEGVEVFRGRIEDINGLRVDAAVTRALFRIGEFVGKAERILNENGVLILSKGPRADEELRDIAGRDVKRQDMVLPFQNSTRHLIIIRKTPYVSQR
jgi:16S rRNA (guanine527-N7)-methyltransferase